MRMVDATRGSGLASEFFPLSGHEARVEKQALEYFLQKYHFNVWFYSVKSFSRLSQLVCFL